MEVLKDDATEIPDRPKLTLAVVDPEIAWSGGGPLRDKVELMRGRAY